MILWQSAGHTSNWNNPAGLNYISATAPNSAISHVNLCPSGRLTDFTTDLNWYLNAYTRVQFNWINA
jgi:hypothetical protein